MSELQTAECMICNHRLYEYTLAEHLELYLTYCDNKDCARYKLVTLQEDV